MAELIIVCWRDIPAQVIVKAGRRSAKRQLDERFQEAIDRAAMRAGLRDTDAYLGEWRRVVAGDCGDDLEAEADGAAARLPAPVALALPSLWRGPELIMVPHLHLAAATRARLSAEVRFRPRTPLAAPRYAAALTLSLPLLGDPDTLC